jgi:hypothetical protein
MRVERRFASFTCRTFPCLPSRTAIIPPRVLSCRRFEIHNEPDLDQSKARCWLNAGVWVDNFLIRATAVRLTHTRSVVVLLACSASC